jgi:serine protease Do
MSNPLYRKAAFSFVVGATTIAAATLGIRAFSDVPRGTPFTQSQASTLSSKPAAGHPVSPADQDLLGRASHAFNEIAQSSMPAVVSITSIRLASTRDSLLPGMPPLPGLNDDDHGDDPSISSHGHGPGAKAPGLTPFPGPGGGGRNHLGGDPSAQDPRVLGIGSGIIIRKDGLILTNNHVVENAERITVNFDEKHKAKAHIVGTDPKTDLAVIKVDDPKRNDYPVIRFGDSDQIREGDWAIAIGSPFGLNRSVSFGIISAKGRAQMGILDIEDFIQTDAAINPGSSGGPLLNSSGELVGINTAIFSEGGGNMGIGFAIPSKIAHEISDKIIADGRVSRGWVGMMAQDLDTDLAKYFKVPATQGALVSEVVPNGPASHASLQSGDVVTRYDQHPVDGASTLKSLVGKTKAGSTVPVEVVRNGRAKMLTLAVLEQPGTPQAPEVQQAGQAGGNHHPPSLGLAVEDVPTEISRFLNLPSRKGTLVVGVNPGSPAFDAGIGPGDIILSANKADVHGAREFNKMAQDLKKQDMAVLYVQRGPTERIFVPVKLNDPSA